MSNDWMSLSEVAQELGVHSSTVRSWADQGRLPVHRTQGGHRRFLRTEVELCMGVQKDRVPEDIPAVIQTAVRRTRMMVMEGELEKKGWYSKLDQEAREQYRLSGRALLQGVIAALTSEDPGIEAEARALGYEYASRGKRCGLNSSEAVQAFLFFRGNLFEAMLTVYESASVRSSHAWGDMLRKMNNFTDSILITLLETYEAYGKNSNRS